MKKFFTRLAAAVMAMVMCLTLCGCGTDLGTMLLMKKVWDSAASVKSVEADLTAEIEGSCGSIPLKAGMEAECRLLADPLELEAATELDMGLFGSSELTAYMLNRGDALELYIALKDKVLLSKSWPLENAPTLKDAIGFIRFIEDSEASIVWSRDEEINGTDAAVLDIVLPAGMIGKCFGEAEDEEPDVITNDLKLTAWIDIESGRLIRLETDLAQLAVPLFIGSEDGQKVDIIIDKLPLVLDITDFNEVESIDIPKSIAEKKADDKLNA